MKNEIAIKIDRQSDELVDMLKNAENNSRENMRAKYEDLLASMSEKLLVDLKEIEEEKKDSEEDAIKELEEGQKFLVDNYKISVAEISNVIDGFLQ